MRYLRAGEFRAARDLVTTRTGQFAGDVYYGAAATFTANVLDDAGLLHGVEPAELWRSAQRGGDADALAFFGGIYATTIGETLVTREILATVFRHTASLEASLEAILIAAELGDDALCASVLARIAPIAQNAAPEFRGVFEHASALTEHAAGERDRARASAARAERAYTRAGWSYYAARAAELCGDLRATHRTYRKLGAVRDLKRLSAGEGQRANADAAASLAPRQREVAELMAAGLTNKEIAERLSISVKTVEKNVTAIYAKLGISRRVHLSRLLTPPPAAHDPMPGNFPQPLTPFIGRAEELAELHERTARNRLVALVGPGGSGKTRLACEFVERERSRYPGGVWFVDLAALVDDAAVWPLIATTLGIPRDAQRSVEATVTAWLSSRAPLLAVLDNCEHLLPAIARTARALLAAGSNVRVLATSRERIGVFGENVFRVGSMRQPDGTAFFRERAHAAGAVIADERLAGTICDRLDGIPLAIELAAARLYDLSLADLAQALQTRLPVLATDAIGVPQRHHSIDALVQWGYEPLSAADQRAFRRSGVFAGAFSLSVAQHLVGPDAPASLELLRRKSLIERLPSGAYRMLQVVRDVALTNLRENGEHDAAFQAFAAYYDDMLAQANDEWYVMPIASWLEPLKTDSHNILAAIDWCLTRKHDVAAGIRMTANAARAWSEMAREPELEPYLAEALRRAPETNAGVRVRLWLAQSRALDIVRAGTQAVEASRRAFDAARESGDVVDIGMSHLAIGSTSATMHDNATAREHLAAALSIFHEKELKRLEASALTALAIIADDDEERAAAFGAVLGIARVLDDPLLEAITLSNLSIVRTVLGDAESARRCAREGIAIFERLGAPMRLARMQIELARTEYACGDLTAACEAASSALHYFGTIGAPPLRADCAAWIAKALSGAAPALAAKCWGYVAAMRAGEAGANDDAPAREALASLLGGDAFARLAAEGAEMDASALLAAVALVRGTVESSSARSTK